MKSGSRYSSGDSFHAHKMQQKYLIPISIIVAAFVIGFFIYFAISQKPAQQNNYPVAQNLTTNNQNQSVIVKTAACSAKDDTIVTKVIDGDTVVVEGGEHVRLLSIDADEKNYPCYEAAKSRLEALVLNKQVRLERDITDVDQYNRCLRTVFYQGVNIDLELVQEGLAVARFYPPDIKYKQEISAAEKQAIADKTGCKWSNTK